MRDFSLSLHSLNRDLFPVVDIHSGLGRLAAYLEALQRPPVVIVVIVSSDGADTCPHFAQVDDVGIPRCADVHVADIGHLIMYNWLLVSEEGEKDAKILE